MWIEDALSVASEPFLKLVICRAHPRVAQVTLQHLIHGVGLKREEDFVDVDLLVQDEFLVGSGSVAGWVVRIRHPVDLDSTPHMPHIRVK